MQIQQQPAGWNHGEVVEALQHLTTIEQSTAEIATATYNTLEFIDVVTSAVFFMILIAGINFGYSISPYFLPKAKDIGA